MLCFCVQNGLLSYIAFLRKLYLFSVNLNFSCMIVGKNWCILLKTLVARTCKFLLWIERDLSFSSNPLNVENLSLMIQLVKIAFLKEKLYYMLKSTFISQ